MLSRQQALELVLDAINPAEPDPYWPDAPRMVVLDEHTMETPWGWVFFWDSSTHQKTGRFEDSLAGNGPYFVNRTDGSLWQAGTAHPVDHYIREYEAEQRFGNPPVVVAVGWRVGMKKVSTTKLLRDRCGLSLKEAHEATNRILDEERVELAVDDYESAIAIAAELDDLGVEVL